MKYYKVVKVDSVTEQSIDYGCNCEEDMRLITRGYKKDDLLPDMYNRAGSKYFFLVTEVTDEF